MGYNVQMAVDTKHNLIAEQQVHSKVSDLGLLAETAGSGSGELWLFCEIDAVADRGYYKHRKVCIQNSARPRNPTTRLQRAALAIL